MNEVILYIGPGIGLGTIVIVLLILAIVLLAFAMLLWIPIKRFLKKIFGRG